MLQVKVSQEYYLQHSTKSLQQSSVLTKPVLSSFEINESLPPCSHCSCFQFKVRTPLSDRQRTDVMVGWWPDHTRILEIFQYPRNTGSANKAETLDCRLCQHTWNLSCLWPQQRNICQPSTSSGSISSNGVTSSQYLQRENHMTSVSDHDHLLRGYWTFSHIRATAGYAKPNLVFN